MKKAISHALMCCGLAFGIALNAFAAEQQGVDKDNSLLLEEIFYEKRILIVDGEEYRVAINVLVTTPEKTNILFSELSPPGNITFKLNDDGFISDIQIVDYE